MVNASLNWASIVGIVLAVGGALLYFMRNFKPALARDYDVFFAAVGLLCGGILIFQGWRLDPILQFGQFLLAGTTVFFAYESVRLRSVTTEQARRSSYFDDEEPPSRPRMGGGRDYGDDYDRFDGPQPISRRIPARDDDDSRGDFYRQRRQPARAAIPERAASRRGGTGDDDRWDSGNDRPASGYGADRASGGYGRERDQDSSGSRGPSRFRAGAGPSEPESFGARRRDRDSTLESRRGSRPTASPEAMPRSSRGGSTMPPAPEAAGRGQASGERRPGIPEGRPLPASAAPRNRSEVSDADFSPLEPPAPRPDRGVSGTAAPQAGATQPPRDNSSRFDD